MLLLERDAPAAFVTRFQQTTPAIMAKGVEDTAFYRYCRLISLNDVGGDPSRFGIDVGWFHASCVERLERFPLNLLTTQTHDAKRSADVRARIDALSSMPDEWAEHVGRWFEITDGRSDGGAPDDVERYFLFQTLVGAWPIARTGSRPTWRRRSARPSGTRMDRAQRRLGGGGQALLPLAVPRRGVPGRFEPFARRVAAVGERASLGQLVLKLTAPGIPDMYEGDELAFRALVDPDNRRPVDFDWRQAMLRRLMGGAAPDAETRKLFVTMRLLGLRTRRPEPFPAPMSRSTPAPRRARSCAAATCSWPSPSGTAPSRGRWRRRADSGATCSAARSARSTPGPRSGHRRRARDRRVRAAVVELAQQFVEVEVGAELDVDVALGVTRPLLGRPVPHQLERVAIGIDDVDRLVGAVVGVLADRPVDVLEAPIRVGQRLRVGYAIATW